MSATGRYTFPCFLHAHARSRLLPFDISAKGVMANIRMLVAGHLILNDVSCASQAGETTTAQQMPIAWARTWVIKTSVVQIHVWALNPSKSFKKSSFLCDINILLNWFRLTLSRCIEDISRNIKRSKLCLNLCDWCTVMLSIIRIEGETLLQSPLIHVSSIILSFDEGWPVTNRPLKLDCKVFFWKSSIEYSILWKVAWKSLWLDHFHLS